MNTGSPFIAALLAVIALHFLEPGRPPSPYWHDAVAAVIGTVIAWTVAAIGTTLRARRVRAT